MSNENITDPAVGNAFNELSNASEVSQPATTDVDGSDTFDLSRELAELLASFTPPESIELPSQTRQTNVMSIEDANITKDESVYQKHPLSIGGNIFKEENYRHPLHWHAAIVNKSSGKHDIYHGRTHDLSLNGASILIERNVSFTTEVVILLSIPPMHLGQKKTIIEIECSTKYTLLDSVHGQFRLEMKFVHFKGDGKKILSDILSKRHIPKEERNPYV